MVQSLQRWLASVVLWVLFGGWLILGTAPALAAASATTELSTTAFDTGVIVDQSRQQAEAVQAFTAATETHPQMASTYSNRCLAELQQALMEQAILDCTRSLELTPTNPNDYLNRGLAYYRLRQPHAALTDFNQALELRPEDYRAYYNRGLVQFDLANYEGAIADYNQSLIHSSAFPNAPLADIYNDRAIAYLAIHHPHQALADLNQVLQFNQDDAKAYFNRACCHEQMGNWEASLKDYDRLLEANPDYPQAYVNRAMLHQRMGHIKAAIVDLNQAADQFHQLGWNTHYQQTLKLIRKLQHPPSTWV